jgi:hypothetical protein
MIFTDEQIQAAAHTEIPQYCKERGLPLVRERGDTYRYAAHVLEIKGSTWERAGNRQEGEERVSGNAIQFVREYEGLSFRDAVISLLAFTKSPLLEDKPSVRVKLETYANEARSKMNTKGPISPDKNGIFAMRKAKEALPREYIEEIDKMPTAELNKKSGEYMMPPAAPTNKNIIAYLNQSRGIDIEIVRELIKRRLLYEDNHGNCVFVGYDRKNVVKYVTLEAAVSGKKHALAGDAPDNKKLYGWSVTPDRARALLHVFQNPVDALSFMTLEKMAGNDWRCAHYLALGSLAPGPIIHFLRMFREIEVVEFSLDDSPAAHRFIREFTGQFADSGVTWKPRIPGAGNWNKQLLYILHPAESMKGE